ncbi:MAG: DUF3829 domain-containing protein [Polyangiaceae bacterium]
MRTGQVGWYGWLLVGLLGVATCLDAGRVQAAEAKQTPKEAKVSTFIAMINSESGHVFDNYARYSKLIADLEKGPTCKELDLQRAVSGMGPSAPERYAGYKKALVKGPKLEVDAAAQEMLSAAEALFKPENEASEYYFKNEYRKDSCKRGTEFNAVLVPNWVRYMKADREMRAFLDKYTDERDTAELTKSEKKYGKALHYYHSKLMMSAKRLIRIANKEPFDAAEVRKQLEAFEPDIGEAQALAKKAGEKDKRTADAIYQGGYSQLLSRCDRFRDTLKEILRVVDEEAKDPKAAKTMPNRRKNSMESMVTAYNGLVDQSNSTMYSKSMK